MQDFLFRHIILPAFYNPRGLNRLQHYLRLKKNDFLSQEELLIIQEKKLKVLLEHCYKNIPYYRRLFKKNNLHPYDIKNLKDITLIPELKKGNIRDNYRDLIDPSLPLKKLRYSATGGSTGIPIKIFKSLEDQEYGFAMRYRSNAWCGWEYWHKSLWVVADLKRLTELTTLKSRASLAIKRRLLLDSRNYTQESMHKWVKQVNKHKPAYVYGYATLLTAFSSFIQENSIELKGIKGVFSTAEPLNTRDMISKAFNAPVYDQYGASEIPCIAHECRYGSMHINIDEVLVEFVDIGDGSGMKKLVCTPLYVYGMPILRYDLGDTAEPVFKSCHCGLPYPVMEFKVGRISDNWISPSGRLISTLDFGWHLAQSAEGIKQYQAIQEEISKYTIKLVCEPELRQLNEEIVRELVKGLLGTSEIELNIEFPDEIKPEANGKYRATVSKVVDTFGKTGATTKI